MTDSARDIVSLKEYFLKLLEVRDREQEKQRAADQNAMEFARDAMDKRLEGMNEFRDTLRDQASRFVTREQLESLKEEVRNLQKGVAVAEGKASQLSMLAAGAMGLAALITSIITMYVAAK